VCPTHVAHVWPESRTEREMAQMVAVDLPFGYPANPVLSPGVAEIVDAPAPNWHDRLWDIVFVSNAAGTQRLLPTLRWFTVHVDLGLPAARVVHFVREDIAGVPHLHLLAEWNAGHKPNILFPQVSMIDPTVGLEAILG
jgi:hypothetical protein